MKLSNLPLDDVHQYAQSLCEEMGYKAKRNRIDRLYKNHRSQLLQVIREVERAGQRRKLKGAA